MKRYITLLLAVVAFVASASAQMKSAYFMEGSYIRTDMNPALAPTRGYVAMPGLGCIGVGITNNFLSVENFFYKSGGETVTFLNKGVSASNFLKNIPETSKLSANVNLNLIGVGIHTPKYYINVTLNVRSHTELALKKDLFRALKDLRTGVYDFSGSGISSTNYMELGAGAAIPIKKNYTIGFRVKGLIGLADVSTDIKNVALDVNENFVRFGLNGSLRGNLVNVAQGYPAGGDFSPNTIFGNNTIAAKSGGLAIDLGFEGRFLDDRLKVSAAITDLGFICWGKQTSVYANVHGGFSFSGVNFDTGDIESSSDEFGATLQPQSAGYTRRLNCSLNVGIEYNILKNHIAFGLLSHTEFGNILTLSELTASVNFRANNWFSATLSHTFLSYNKLGIFGCALNFHPAGFNFFLGMDYIGCSYAKMNGISIPSSMKSANFYMGLGFNIGKAKYMKVWADEEQIKNKENAKAAKKSSETAANKSKKTDSPKSKKS